ncbi:MAG TPA: hypothetical protein PKA88_01265 [Polyangiaceae bacterium]|nr:hypothetical protein [Polyangiaceae bacterium]
MANTSALKIARAARDELTRQLLLEKRYDYLAGPDDNGLPKIGKSVTRALAGFEFGVTLEGRLDSLREAADRVLVRADGMVFNVALIDVVKKDPLTDRIGLAHLVEIGESLTGMTGKVAGNTLPVTFQIFEIFPHGIPAGYAERTSGYQRRGVQSPKIGVGVVAIDAASGATWSNFPGLVRWAHVQLARRALRDRHMGRAEREAMLENSGFHLDKALLATAGASALGSLALWGMLQAKVQSGQLYGGVIVIVAVLAAVVSLKLCRVVHATALQAGAAGTATALTLALTSLGLGLGFGLSSVITLAAASFMSFAIGVVDNPQGRRQ